MTAIEWLIEKHFGGIINCTPEFRRYIYQAKEMEKQQLYNFYVQGGFDCVTQADRTVEDFYNETFKSEL